MFNVDGRYYALRNTCPHAGAPLCEGTLSGLVTSGAPGEYTYERDVMISSPAQQAPLAQRSGSFWNFLTCASK